MDYSAALLFLRRSDPLLASVIERVGSCVLSPDDNRDLLACLAETIIYQQLSGKAAATIHRRFREIYGELPNEPLVLTPTDILNTPDEVLRGAGLSRSKVSYLKNLAQWVPELPTLKQLEALDDEAIVTLLTQVKGIGRWSVQMLLIFRMNRLDVFPVDDLGVRTAIQKLYGLTALPDQKTMEQLGLKWKPYRSIATWYLWRSLDQPLGSRA